MSAGELVLLVEKGNRSTEVLRELNKEYTTGHDGMFVLQPSSRYSSICLQGYEA